jgi:hypothetical protein
MKYYFNISLFINFCLPIIVAKKMTAIMSRSLYPPRPLRSYLYHLIKEGKRSNMWIHKKGTTTWITPEDLEILAKDNPYLDFCQEEGYILADPAKGVRYYDELISSVEEKVKAFETKLKWYERSKI